MNKQQQKDQAYKKYEAIKDQAYEEYLAIRGQAYKKYEAKCKEIIK